MKRFLTHLFLLLVVLGCHMEVPEAPVAAFTFTNGECLSPCTVAFTATTDNVTSYEWDFNDRSPIVRGKTAEHRFEGGKSYHVKLLVKNKDGASSGTTQVVVIKAAPAAEAVADFDFTLSNGGIAPSTATFDDQSKNAARYEWTIEDPNATPNPTTSTEARPTHLFSKAGKYKVTLVVYNGENKPSAAKIKEVEIKAKGPNAAFTITGGDCDAPCDVTFTNGSTEANEYSWDFGDQKTSTDTSPKHTYDQPGTYTITLTAKGPGGTDTETHQVTIKEKATNAIAITGDYNFPTDIVADGSGNIYVCGEARGTTNFGNGKVLSTRSGSKDFFVAKYNSSGTCLWAYLEGSSADDHANALAIDGNDVYVTGFIGAATQISGSEYQGGLDVFVAKLSGSNGSRQWFKSFGGPNNDEGKGLGFFQTPDGPRVYLAGNVNGDGRSMNINFFNGQSATYAIGQNIFFVFVDASTGQVRQPTVLRQDGGQSVEAIAVDNEGNAYMTGHFNQTMNFEGRSKAITSYGASDTFVAKWVLNPGQFVWAFAAGSPNDDYAYDITVDNDKNVYTTGQYVGPMDPLGVGSRGDINVFLGKWFANGNGIHWGRSGFNNGNNDSPGGLGITPNGNIILSGAFPGSGSFPFDSPHKFESGGNSDILITEVGPADGLTTNGFQVSAGGRGEERTGRLCVASDGTIYSSGWFSGSATFNGVTLNSTSGERNTYIVKYKR